MDQGLTVLKGKFVLFGNKKQNILPIERIQDIYLIEIKSRHILILNPRQCLQHTTANEKNVGKF